MFDWLFNKKKSEIGPKVRYFNGPVVFTFDEGEFHSTEWNLEGCRLSNYHGRKNENNTFNIRGVNGAGEPIRYVLIHARVTKRSRVSGELWLKFESLNPNAEVALDGLINKSVKKSLQVKQASTGKKIFAKA